MGKSSHVAVILWKGNEVSRTPVISYDRAAAIAERYVSDLQSEISAIYGDLVEFYADDWQWWHEGNDCVPLCEVVVLNLNQVKGV